VGATLVLQQAAGIQAGTLRQAFSLVRFAVDQKIIPRVTLTEAVEDMVTRAPKTLRRAAERTAARIAELYSEERTLAFAYSAEKAVTDAAHSFIIKALKEGIPEGEAGRRLSMSVNDIRSRSKAWSESYARMVFRTNVNTAVTAGRFRQAQDQDIKAVIPAFRYDAVNDGATRDNHRAADGIILPVDDPQWRFLAPPLGYNCRCRVVGISRPVLLRKHQLDSAGKVKPSRVPPEARPDPGFRHTGRPDLFIVGASR